MNRDRRRLLKLAGMYGVGVAPLFVQNAIAQSPQTDTPYPACPSGWILVEMRGVCWRVGHRTYRPGRRYWVRACYQREGHNYRVSAPPFIKSPGTLFWGRHPRDPRKGLRLVLVCIYLKGDKQVGVFGCDAPPCCEPETTPTATSAAAVGTIEEIPSCTELDYCLVTCEGGTVHCIPDIPGNTYPCPEGPKGCSRPPVSGGGS
jgi:hypothetical protein